MAREGEGKDSNMRVSELRHGWSDWYRVGDVVGLYGKGWRMVLQLLNSICLMPKRGLAHGCGYSAILSMTD